MGAERLLLHADKIAVVAALRRSEHDGTCMISVHSGVGDCESRSCARRHREGAEPCQRDDKRRCSLIMMLLMNFGQACPRLMTGCFTAAIPIKSLAQTASSGPVDSSLTAQRFFHLATVFWLMP